MSYNKFYVYSKDGCGFCDKLTNFMESKGVEFEKFDLGTDFTPEEFLYKFGKKIFDKIMDVMQPQFQDEKPVNPFDFWEGADFKLKIRQVEGYRNYDKSEFASASGLYEGDDEKLESVYNRLFSLQEFLDPKNYKSYAELQAKLARVLGEAAAPLSTAESVTLDETAPSPSFPTESAPAPQSSEASSSKEDDTMSYFAKLAQEG